MPAEDFTTHFFERVSYGDQLQRFFAVGIGDAAISADPVVHDLAYQSLLIDEWRHDEDPFDAESSPRPCEVMNIEIRNGGGDCLTVTISDRIMNQRQVYPTCQ